MKQRIVTAVSVAALLFVISIAAAQERGRQVTVPASQVVDGDYFALGQMVEISGTINGDLYASGGKSLSTDVSTAMFSLPAAESVYLEPFLRMCGLPAARYRLPATSAET